MTLSHKSVYKYLLVALFALAVIAVTWQSSFAGGVDPDQPKPTPVPDARICGRDGNTVQAQTIRWTDVFSTADPDATTGKAYTPNTSVTIKGRDFWGCWVYVDGATQDGWVPVSALNTNTVMSLPIMFDNSAGQCLKDGVICGVKPTPSTPAPGGDPRICGRDGGNTVAKTTRWTDVFSIADPDATTGKAYTPNTPVTIQGRDFWGCWVKVDGASHDGWVPVSALDTNAVMSLPVMFDNSGGQCLKDGKVCSGNPATGNWDNGGTGGGWDGGNGNNDDNGGW